jgi:hypothetical protein
MRISSFVFCLVAGPIVAGLVALPSAAYARPKKKKSEVDTAEPAKLEAKLRLSPKGLRFGLSPKRVAKVYDKVVDQDYLKRFQDTEPGIQQQRLESEVERKKALFRRGIVKFGDLPTTLDSSALAGEFSYMNREAMMQIKRRGKKRMLFFIRGKLWKVFDVFALGPKAKWGADFKAAIERLEKRLGTEGRARTAGEESGLQFEEVDWASSGIRLRAINWGDRLALCYVDQATEGRIDALRPNKGKKKEQLDDTVRESLR